MSDDDKKIIFLKTRRIAKPIFIGLYFISLFKDTTLHPLWGLRALIQPILMTIWDEIKF
jgi:hypothetical protein